MWHSNDAIKMSVKMGQEFIAFVKAKQEGSTKEEIMAQLPLFIAMLINQVDCTLDGE
jgi:hypothetical protein